MTEKRKNFLDHFSTIFLGIFIVLFVWTFSISLPIYVRSFYYAQVNEIEKTSGYSKETIKEAYDEVLDYLTKGKEFGTGSLKCSESAKDHFADCKTLFDLNLALLIISAVGIVVIVALALVNVVGLKKYKGFNIWFYAAIFTLGLPLIFLAVAAINFDTAFAVFHKILFPGKTNWYFDPVQDEIINILPEMFFANCGILIGCSIFVCCAAMMSVAIVQKCKKRKSKKGGKIYYKICKVENGKTQNLPQNITSHIKTHKNKSLANESLCAWTLLDELLRSRFEISLEDAEIEFSKNGKPTSKKVYVGISHSHGFCAVCAANVPCAIDIQKIDPGKNFAKLSKYTFGKEIDSCNEFYQEWTKNEAKTKLFDSKLLNKNKKNANFEFFEEDGFFVCIASTKEFVATKA